MRFKDKIVLVTGSATGIGRATALKFAHEGAIVIINSKSNRNGGQTVAREIGNLGGRSLYVQADVSDEQAVSRLFAEIIKEFGTIDILINNAGHTSGEPFQESTRQHWLEQFNTNFLGTVLCSRKAAKIMKKRDTGKIIMTTSIRGLPHTGREGIMAYSAAKAAVISFTKTLAKELAPHITVNAVAPGFVLTRAYDTMSEQAKKDFLESTLIKRWITPEEIADAFLYLAGADAVTGHVLVVDGGFTLK